MQRTCDRCCRLVQQIHDLARCSECERRTWSAVHLEDVLLSRQQLLDDLQLQRVVLRHRDDLRQLLMQVSCDRYDL